MKKIILISVMIILSKLSYCQPTISFTEHSIDENFKGVSVICVKDIDKDGLKDLVCGSESTSSSSISIGIWWLKNNGNSNWTRYEIDAGFNNVMSIEIVDINKDGNWDILASGWNASEIAYWINDGDTIPNWTKIAIKSNFYMAHDAHAFDINKDSLTDIVGLSAYFGQVNVWYQQADGSFTEQIIDSTFTGARALNIADYNGDGNIDIAAVSASKKQLVVYYSNNTNPIVWTKKIVNSNLNGAHEVVNLDFNSDGHIDLLTSAYNSSQIDIWLNNGTNNVIWTRKVVGSHVGVSRALSADFDNDGDIDIVATGKYPTSKLSVWFNTGNTSNTFSEVIINDQLNAFWALAVDDFDNDGDFDIIAGASVNGIIRWWENHEYVERIDSQNLKYYESSKICPNPSNGKFKVFLKQNYSGTVEFQLFNIEGNIILPTSKITNYNDLYYDFNCNTLKNGVYLLKIQYGNEVEFNKIFINN